MLTSTSTGDMSITFRPTPCTDFWNGIKNYQGHTTSFNTNQKKKVHAVFIAAIKSH